MYVKTGRLLGKMQPRSTGPYTIESVGNNHYHVVSDQGKRLQVNIDRIIPVIDEIREHAEVAT